MSTRYDEKQRAEAIELARKVGMREAARRLGFPTHARILEWTKAANGAPPRVRRPKVTKQQRLAAVVRSEEVGADEAAREIGVKAKTLSNWRSKFALAAAQRVAASAPPRVLSTPEQALAGEWPGKCLRVCLTYLTPMRTEFYLYPRGAKLPHASVETSRFKLERGDAPERASYMDGELNAQAIGLSIHPALLDAISADIAGDHRVAAQCIGCEIAYRLTGREAMSEAELRSAARASRGLRHAGFYDHASTDSQKATIAALVARDLRAMTATEVE